MSRADELRRKASDCSQPGMVFWRKMAEQAIVTVGELEATITASDARIDGLEKQLKQVLESENTRRRERDAALDRIAELERQVEWLRRQLQPILQSRDIAVERVLELENRLRPFGAEVP